MFTPKRDATTLALQETLKGFISQKDKAIEEKKEREEKKQREREENAKNFFDLQKKKLEIDETDARSRAMEAEQALLAEESRIMMSDLNTMGREEAKALHGKTCLIHLNLCVAHKLCGKWGRMGPRAPLFFGYYVMPRQMGTRTPLFGYNVLAIWQCLYVYCNLFEIYCLKKKVQGGANGSAHWVHWPEKAGWGRTPVRFPAQTEQKRTKNRSV